jgi:hypothetical protein
MTAQEQAEEIRDVSPAQWETKAGKPVLAVFSDVVYVLQKAVTAEDFKNWRKQLS